MVRGEKRDRVKDYSYEIERNGEYVTMRLQKTLNSSKSEMQHDANCRRCIYRRYKKTQTDSEGTRYRKRWQLLQIEGRRLICKCEIVLAMVIQLLHNSCYIKLQHFLPLSQRTFCIVTLQNLAQTSIASPIFCDTFSILLSINCNKINKNIADYQIKKYNISRGIVFNDLMTKRGRTNK